MFKRLKAMIMAALMATIFPVLRIPGNEAPAATDPETPRVPPVKTPEERIQELEGELTDKTARIAELEKEVKQTNDVATFKLAEREQAVNEANQKAGSLKKAVSSYKALITASNPDILPELISGETIEDLDASLNKARELIGKVKTNLDQQAQKKRIPAGAPPRREPDGSGLSAREKIQKGIQG